MTDFFEDFLGELPERIPQRNYEEAFSKAFGHLTKIDPVDEILDLQSQAEDKE